MADEKQQLATIAAVLDDSEKLLDKLFANVADLKAMLARTPPAPHDKKAASEANATIEQLHETQIAACEIGNQTLAKEILLWTHIAAAAKPATAAQRKADDQLLSFIRATFAPRPCARIYRLR